MWGPAQGQPHDQGQSIEKSAPCRPQMCQHHQHITGESISVPPELLQTGMVSAPWRPLQEAGLSYWTGIFLDAEPVPLGSRLKALSILLIPWQQS